MDRNYFLNIFWQKIFWKKKLLNFIPIPWKWTSECFKIGCGQKIWIEITFQKISKYSANMHNFTISICYKSNFIEFTNYKSDISHFASLSRSSSPVVSPPLCLGGLGSHPNATRYPRSEFPLCLSAFHLGSVGLTRRDPRWKAERHNGNSDLGYLVAFGWEPRHNGGDTTGEEERESDAKWEMSLL